MEFQQDELIQVLDDKWTILRVLNAEKFNRSNKASVLVWDSREKVQKKIAIHPAWENSAVESAWRATGGTLRLLPEIRYLAQWSDSNRRHIMVFDTWRNYD